VTPMAPGDLSKTARLDLTLENAAGGGQDSHVDAARGHVAERRTSPGARSTRTSMAWTSREDSAIRQEERARGGLLQEARFVLFAKSSRLMAGVPQSTAIHWPWRPPPRGSTRPGAPAVPPSPSMSVAGDAGRQALAHGVEAAASPSLAPTSLPKPMALESACCRDISALTARAVLPHRITSPPRMKALCTSTALMKVPLVEPRSMCGIGHRRGRPRKCRRDPRDLKAQLEREPVPTCTRIGAAGSMTMVRRCWDPRARRGEGAHGPTRPVAGLATVTAVCSRSNTEDPYHIEVASQGARMKHHHRQPAPQDGEMGAFTRGCVGRHGDRVCGARAQRGAPGGGPSRCSTGTSRKRARSCGCSQMRRSSRAASQPPCGRTYELSPTRGATPSRMR